MTRRDMVYDYVSSLCNSASALAEEPSPCFREKERRLSPRGLGAEEEPGEEVQGKEDLRQEGAALRILLVTLLYRNHVYI